MRQALAIVEHETLGPAGRRTNDPQSLPINRHAQCFSVLERVDHRAKLGRGALTKLLFECAIAHRLEHEGETILGDIGGAHSLAHAPAPSAILTRRVDRLQQLGVAFVHVAEVGHYIILKRARPVDARRGNRDQHFAEDLVQEALLRAWRSLHTLRDVGAAKGWLMMIVRREHARYYERQRPEPMDIQARDFPEALLVHRDEAPEIGELRQAIFDLDDESLLIEQNRLRWMVR